MEVRFKTEKLRKCFLKHKEALRCWPEDVARKFVLRIQVLQNMRTPEELKAFRQFNHHELTGDHAGEHVIHLSARYRLHFLIEEDAVIITEVSKHYGD